MVRTIAGVDRARALPGVVDVGVDAAPGEDVAPLRSSRDRAGHVVAQGSTRAEAQAAATRALAAIRIETMPAS